MLSRATMHLSCPEETAPFMAQDGCAFIHTKKIKKQQFCWHQAQAWPEKLNGWMMCMEMCFIIVYKYKHKYPATCSINEESLTRFSGMQYTWDTVQR